MDLLCSIQLSCACRKCKLSVDFDWSMSREELHIGVDHRVHRCCSIRTHVLRCPQRSCSLDRTGAKLDGYKLRTASKYKVSTCMSKPLDKKYLWWIVLMHWSKAYNCPYLMARRRSWESVQFVFRHDSKRRSVAKVHLRYTQMNQYRCFVLLHESRTTLKDRIEAFHRFAIIIFEQLGFAWNRQRIQIAGERHTGLMRRDEPRK